MLKIRIPLRDEAPDGPAEVVAVSAELEAQGPEAVEAFYQQEKARVQKVSAARRGKDRITQVEES